VTRCVPGRSGFSLEGEADGTAAEEGTSATGKGKEVVGKRKGRKRSRVDSSAASGLVVV
jgi:hypothetical protein